jgi:uncharacterized protein YjeT (DUF2065 family)
MTNIQILQIISIIYIFLGLGILINPKYHLKVFKKMIDDESYTYLYGLMGLTVGYLLITFSGITTGWFIIIPIFGWIGFIKGILFFLAPQALMNIAQAFTKKKEYLTFIGILAIMLGGIFAYVSFFVL